MVQARVVSGRRPVVFALLFGMTAMLAALALQGSATADVSGITARAFGYYTNVGFLDGPPTRLGFGQTVPPGTAESASPSVDCPSSGSPLVTQTDPDGARAVYGPAVIFGGQQPENATTAPPSGPLTVSCQGTTGPAGSATSSADVINVGPGPFTAAEVHSTCTANETGVSGTTTIVGGNLETSDTTSEPVPATPTIGYTRTGTVLGDSYRIVFNEQILNADGSLTVNAVHMYLLGPFAEGDMVIASSTCGVQVPQSTTTIDGGTTTTTDGNTTTTNGNTTTTNGNTTTTEGNTTTTNGNTTTTNGNTTTTGGNTTTTGAGGTPTNKDQCKDGGWAAFGFRNQGQCVSFVERNGGG